MNLFKVKEKNTLQMIFLGDTERFLTNVIYSEYSYFNKTVYFQRKKEKP